MKRVYELLKNLESELKREGSLKSQDLLKLKQELSKHLNSEEKWLAHLAKTSASLSENLSLKDLMLYTVPIERHLGKRVTDTDILISFEDRKNSVKENTLKIVVDNVRSAFNTGAIFRTCEALGVSEVILTGYTQGFESEQVVKTSMGARTNTKRLRDLKEAKDYLKNYCLVALETSNRSRSIFDSDFTAKTAFVLGNERFGISEEDLLLCEKAVCLPTFGLKNSLNVNAALSACGYEWVRRFG